MKTKIEIKSIWGELRFSFEKEGNTIQKTVIEALKRSADLRSAYLSGADYNENTVMLLPQCPSEGSFVAWKKAGNVVVKLEVCSDAMRSSATTLKCRCSSALVLEIQELDGTKSEIQTVVSNHDGRFVYRAGEVSTVADFDTDRWNECSAGIHFFISREMAVKY